MVPGPAQKNLKPDSGRHYPQAFHRRPAMLFVIQFRDDPKKRHLRPELMAAHLAFLKANDARVRVAGSLRHESDDRAIGGMWIVDVEKFADVKELYTQDPFWTGGLRASVEVYRYAKAFPEIENKV